MKNNFDTQPLEFIVCFLFLPFLTAFSSARIIELTCVSHKVTSHKPRLTSRDSFLLLVVIMPPNYSTFIIENIKQNKNKKTKKKQTNENKKQKAKITKNTSIYHGPETFSKLLRKLNENTAMFSYLLFCTIISFSSSTLYK